MAKLVATVTDEMKGALEGLAESDGIPTAILTREAIAQYLANRGVKVQKVIKWGGPRRTDDDKNPAA